MSRRFGRQQKRQMRAALQIAQREASEVQLLRSLHRRSSQIVERVGQVLGHNFAAVPPQELRGEIGRLMDQWRVPMRQGYMPLELAHEFVPVALKVLELDILKGQLKTDLSQNQHFRFVCGRKTIGYALNSSLAYQLPRNVWVPQIAHEMAEQMYSLLGAPTVSEAEQ